MNSLAKGSEEIGRPAAWLAESRFAVAMTGAGLGTESGIPDFRSPGGIWTRLDPKDFTYRYYVNNLDSRIRYWRMTPAYYARNLRAVPHAGHQAFADLRRQGVLRRVITQNTDGLLQKAGFPEEDLIEIHGTSHWVRCLDCGMRESRESVNRRVEAGELPRQIADDRPGPEESTRRAELRRRVWRAVSELAPAKREIVVLRDFHDLAYAEIANVLGIPIGTVMSRLHAARKALREILIRDGFEPSGGEQS